MFRRPLLAAAAALAALAALTLVACGAGGEGEDGAGSGGDGPEVVATTTIVADLARQVGGDRAEVSSLLRPNSDPHDYEPRPSDARAVAGAGLVVRSGGDLDEWLDDVIRNAGGDAREVTLMDVARTREGGGHAHEEEGEEHAEEEGEEHADERDPHWWQDPRNAQAAVMAIRDALTEADPGGRAEYSRNAQRSVDRIAALDRAIERCFAAIPEQRRKLVTNHDAFGYFADRYGLEVVGTVIPSRSTQGQASAARVTDLVDTIRRERVRAIFSENSVSPRVERAIAREAGARLGPPLIADALSAEGEPGDSYESLLRTNAQRIADGLTGRRGACELPGR